jgi:hypothetical protein
MPPQSVDGSRFIEPIRCNKCGETAYLMWRAPHPDISHAEIQIFQCPRYGHQTERLIKL